MIAWAIVRAWTKRVSYAGLVAGVLIVVSVGILSFWLIEGTGVASHEIQTLETKSFLGRVGHSSEGRMHIWKALWRRFSKTPLGYGPGNSRWQVLTIEERDRPLKGPTETFDSGADPFASKEAHNDYLAYLMERGPVALAAMLIMKLLVFGRITQWWRDRAASAPGRARGGAIAAAMFGAWVGSWINSNTIETLHFRHVWVFLAMVYGLRAAVTAPAPATSVASERERPALAGAHAVALP
ncbi:MAG TPA: O-antigen ligase family protein [Candidatus Eisenbacteria bacterium]